MSERREGGGTTLHRGMGFWGAFATAVGLVVAGSTMVSLVTGFGLGGQAFFVAALIAGVVSMLIALSYAELANMLPGAGMIGDYTAPALGRLFAIFGVVGGYIVLVGAVSNVEALIAGEALNGLFSAIPVLPVALAIPLILLVVNLLGIEVFARVQLVLTVVMMAVLVVLGVVGLLGIGGEPRLPEVAFNPAGWGELTQLIALAIFLFVGIEYVCPMSEEIRDPGRNIPRAMIIGILVIFVADMLFGLATLLYTDHETLANANVPYIVGAEGIAGQAGLVVIVVATVFASASSLDSNLAAVPRMLYGLAREGMIPKIFGYIHPRFRTPWVSIFAVFALQVIPLLTFSNSDLITTLILIAVVTWLVSYILAQVDVIVLRRKYPDARRTFKTPLYPVPQLIGIAACIFMIVNIHPDPGTRTTVLVSAAITALIILLYGVVWLRFVKRLPLFEAVPLEEELETIRRRSE